MKLLLILTTFTISAVISYFWAKSIDYINKHHSDYKGEDLFGEPYNKEKEEDK